MTHWRSSHSSFIGVKLCFCFQTQKQTYKLTNLNMGKQTDTQTGKTLILVSFTHFCFFCMKSIFMWPTFWFKTLRIILKLCLTWMFIFIRHSNMDLNRICFIDPNYCGYLNNLQVYSMNKHRVWFGWGWVVWLNYWRICAIDVDSHYLFIEHCVTAPTNCYTNKHIC